MDKCIYRFLIAAFVCFPVAPLVAGQVSVINPSGTTGTIGTVIIPVILPPSVVTPTTPTPSTPTPSTPSTPTPSPSTSTTSNSTINTTETSQPDLPLVSSSGDDASSIPQTDSGPMITKDVGSNNQAGSAELNSNNITNSVGKTTNSQLPSIVAVGSATYANFTSAQISNAIQLIESNLNTGNLTPIARQMLISELSRLRTLSVKN